MEAKERMRNCHRAKETNKKQQLNAMWDLGSLKHKRNMRENLVKFQKISNLVNSVVLMLICWFWSLYYDFINC